MNTPHWDVLHYFHYIECSQKMKRNKSTGCMKSLLLLLSRKGSIANQRKLFAKLNLLLYLAVQSPTNHRYLLSGFCVLPITKCNVKCDRAPIWHMSNYSTVHVQVRHCHSVTLILTWNEMKWERHFM